MRQLPGPVSKPPTNLFPSSRVTFAKPPIFTMARRNFSDEKTADYDDIVAILRTLIVLVNFITCFFIMANIVHNW